MRRPEDPREHDRDHEADERGEDQQQHRVSARDRPGVERAAAEADAIATAAPSAAMSSSWTRRRPVSSSRVSVTAARTSVTPITAPRSADSVQAVSSEWTRIAQADCPAAPAIAATTRAAGGDAEQRSRERHRPDLGGEREPRLPAPRAAREQPAALGGEPAAQADRGDDREAEQQRAGRAADEHQPPRGDPAAPVGVEQLVVGAGRWNAESADYSAVCPRDSAARVRAMSHVCRPVARSGESQE